MCAAMNAVLLGFGLDRAGAREGKGLQRNPWNPDYPVVRMIYCIVLSSMNDER